MSNLHTLKATDTEIILDGETIAPASAWDDSLDDCSAAQKITGLDIRSDSFEARWSPLEVATVMTFETHQ